MLLQPAAGILRSAPLEGLNPLLVDALDFLRYVVLFPCWFFSFG